MSLRHLACFLGLALAGCVQPGAKLCDNGKTCPAETACDLIHDQCVEPSQLTSCGGLGDGDGCTVRAPDDGVCDQGVCLTKRCGDGYRRDNEACDGADIPAGMDCTKLGFYFTGVPTCNDACSFDTNPETTACTGYCGDGVMTPGIEVCETDVALTASCVDQGYGTGALQCVDCRPDTRACIPFGWEFDDTPGSPDDVHGTAPNDVWALFHDNAHNYILQHYDGTTWTTADLSGCSLASGVTDQLYMLWAPTTGVVFAAGDATLIRVAGGVCTKFALPGNGYAIALWASGPDDAWVGIAGHVWQHDAAGWNDKYTAPFGGIRSLWGTSPTDVYTTYDGGNGQQVVHYTGAPTWSPVSPGVPNPQAIWGTSATDVYIGSYSDATIAHFNGAIWSPVRSPPPSIGGGTNGDGIRQGVARDGKLYIVGGVPSRAFVYDGVGWTSLEAPPGTDRMWVGANGKAFATNLSAAKITRFTGSGRISTASGTLSGAVLVPKASDDVYTIKIDLGTQYVYHWDGAVWTKDTNLPSANAVAVGPSGTAFATTYTNGLYKRNSNGTWTQYTNVNGLGLVVLADNDVWVLDTYKIVHWTSGSSAVDFMIDLPGLFPNAIFYPEALWASSPTDIYIIGWSQDTNSVNTPVVLHNNGVPASGWTKQTLPAGPRRLLGVYPRSASDIYAISDDGIVIHTTGNGVWTEFATPPDAKVYDVAGTPPDLFLATSRGLLHSDGSGGWIEVSLGSQLNALRTEVVGDVIMAIDGPGGFHEILRLGPW